MRTIFAEYNPHRNSIDVYANARYICIALKEARRYNRKHGDRKVIEIIVIEEILMANGLTVQ